MKARKGVYRFRQGSVDTPTTGVDTVLQTQGKMMKKWSSGVDTGSSSVDTSPSSQRSQLTGLYYVSTHPQVVSTLDLKVDIDMGCAASFVYERICCPL
ncbi:hypothetical protein Taro_002967 [Colocasia esculenta]|uniref:Uncharacterized protein n=1 Tax=Colocasia esculenta TaxID=4460 RepID=A0A843TI05_COLES|nr:hypothetical protein [Colocasia esculenta]